MTTIDAEPTSPIEDEELGITGSGSDRRYRAQTLWIVAGFVAVLLAGILSIRVGTDGATVQRILGTFWAKLTFTHTQNSNLEILREIIWQLRVPRVLLAIFGGAALSVAGTIYQGLLRNPLVSPYTLGTAPAAAFGAAVSILILGASGLEGYTLIFGALIAAVGDMAIVLALASKKNLDSTTLILLGIALTQLFAALTAGIEFFANDNVLAVIVQWTWGTVNDALWYQAVTMMIVVVIAYPYLQYRSGALNAIAFAGDDAAKTLGVPVVRLRLELIVIATLLTAVSISFMGIIGFVGLVGPHIARLVIGANHRFLLPFSALVGAVILVGADIIGRVIFEPIAIPAGIIDALVGAPIFIYLVVSRRKAL